MDSRISVEDAVFVFRVAVIRVRLWSGNVGRWEVLNFVCSTELG